MFQNTKLHAAYGYILIATLLMFFSAESKLRASPGSDLAKETLRKVRMVSTRQDLNSLLQRATQEKSHLSSEDRIDYIEYLDNVLGKTGTDQESTMLSECATRLIPGGASDQEITAGASRLLSSDDPIVRRTGENLIRGGSVKLPNGELGQDISVFNIALHDPKTRQDRLISALFEIAPVESAQWFADHSGLSVGDRAALESDLQKAWNIHRAADVPLAEPGTKAMLNDSVKNPLLDNWLHSPSWILRSLADGLLRKHPEWQTPELKKSMQGVRVPDGVQVSSTEWQPVSK
jgi:hypothetical protein